MRLPLSVPGLALLALACACSAPDTADVGSAGEAVVRHLIGENFGASETSPWGVVCLRLRDGFQVEDQAGFLRRFSQDRTSDSDRIPPVVPGDRCEAVDDEMGSRWRLDRTQETALLIELRAAEQAGTEKLRIEAAASGGPIDFSVYECMLGKREGRWEVEYCRAHIMT